MSLLDLQTLQTPEPESTDELHTGSRASLLLCGDSSLSVTTCK
ncbi:SapB/AmfS family lanthipeptide [Streptomyces sp. NPDC058000]